MLAMAGQDIDQFMREMEVVHKKRETERAQDLNARLSLLEAENEPNSKSNNKSVNNKTEEEDLEPPGASDHSSNHNQHTSHSHSQHTQPHTMPPMGLPPPPLMYRPPPPPLHLRMPPPPPPRIGLRLPPGKNKLYYLIIYQNIYHYLYINIIYNIAILYMKIIKII